MSNEKQTQTTNTAGPLWRVNYRYLVNAQLRNQAYYVNAKDAAEAKTKAIELLNNRFGKTETKYTIGKIQTVEL